MPTLQTLLPAEVFSYLLVFSRIGTTISVLPGFGESYVSPRIRLLLALTITVVLTPVVSDRLPALPASPLSLLLLVGGVVGAQLGARLAPRISADRLRLMLAIMVLAVGARMLWDLTVAPEDTYYIDPATL